MDPRVPLFELYFDSIAGPPIQGCPDGAPLFVGSSTGAHCAVPLSVLPGEWGRCVSACHFRLKASLDGGISLRAKQGDVWVLRPKPHTGPAAEWECLAAGRSMPVSFGTRIAIPGSGGSRFSRILHWRLEKAGAGVAADATPAAPKPQPSAGKKRSLAEQQAVAGSPSSKRLQAAGNARKHQQQQQQQQQEHAGDAPKVRPQHPEQRSQHAEQQQQQQQEQQEQQQRRKQTKPQRLHPQMLQHKAASEGAFTAAGPFLAAGMSTHLRHMAERQGADPACVGDASQWLQFRCGRRRAFYHRLLRAVLCYYRHSSRSVGQAVTSRRHFASAVNGSPGWRSTFRLLDGTLLKDALKNA
ncbi:hypothetical protein ABPG75_003084 [Micractinium tetrahymenae]